MDWRKDANRKYLKEYRKDLRRRSTRAERIMWQHLRAGRLSGLKFRRQCSIGNYILDFYCHPLRLGIEIDGSIHDLPHIKANDIRREDHLRAMGVTIIRFTNEEVFSDVGAVVQGIEEVVSGMLGG